jgi:hypothetical protein
MKVFIKPEVFVALSFQFGFIYQLTLAASQLVFEEIECPEGNLFNILLGNLAKVNKWNS